MPDRTSDLPEVLRHALLDAGVDAVRKTSHIDWMETCMRVGMVMPPHVGTNPIDRMLVHASCRASERTGV